MSWCNIPIALIDVVSRVNASRALVQERRLQQHPITQQTHTECASGQSSHQLFGDLLRKLVDLADMAKVVKPYADYAEGNTEKRNSISTAGCWPQPPPFNTKVCQREDSQKTKKP
jgi:hypothetical protein